MTVFESILAQNEQMKQKATSGNKISEEDRMKKYFTTVLPKGVKSAEKRIRILPTVDGTTPFIEVKFHEIQVGDKWLKLYDPLQEGKRSPLNEIYEELQSTGLEADKTLSYQYRSRKFFIVKVIDRDNEADGVKFWRFKHNSKGEGVYDKIYSIFKTKGDITDINEGRDLILSLNLTKSGNGKEYTNIVSVIHEDKSPLHTDIKKAEEWVNEPLTWNDVYSKKPLEYLEMVASGDVPRWDSITGKYVSTLTNEENVGETVKTQTTVSNNNVVDAQEGDEPEEDLPF